MWKSYVKNHYCHWILKQRLYLKLHLLKEVQEANTKFAISSIRQTRKYNPHYILADRAYDTEPIRKCINEYVGAFDQIPIKTRAKKGHYRLNSLAIFRPKIYRLRSNVEGVFSVIKRLFNGTNRSRTLQLANKETKLKNTIYNIYRSTQINQKWGFLQSQKKEKNNKKMELKKEILQ